MADTNQHTEWLQQFRPLLHYDSRETFRADAPNAITDVEESKGLLGYCNVLRRGDGTLIAAADPALYGDRCPKLSLDFLQATYEDGTSASQDDYLQEDGPHPALDAARMHSRPEIADRVCGRVAPDGDRVWLQYWLFFYYNEMFLDDHQGDWEMVQIALTPEGEPVSATLSAHAHGGTHDYTALEKSKDDPKRCVVYPALGSHAVYPDSGMHHSGWLDGFDRHDGKGPIVDPELLPLDDSPAAWGGWPGVWGATRGRIASSPVAPKEQGTRWSDPRKWSIEGEASHHMTLMAEEGTIVVLPAPPLAPKIAAERDENAIVVHYDAPVSSKGARAASLLLTLRSADSESLPLTFTSLVRQEAGELRLPLPPDDEPRSLEVTALDVKGQESPQVEVDLTHG